MSTILFMITLFISRLERYLAVIHYQSIRVTRSNTNNVCHKIQLNQSQPTRALAAEQPAGVVKQRQGIQVPGDA